MTDLGKATPVGAVVTGVQHGLDVFSRSANVVYDENGRPIAVNSFEAAPESHTSMVKYMIIGVMVIAVMLIFWLMSQGPVKPYEFKSFMGFTPAPVQIQTHQRMYGVIPSLMGNGLSN
jgi:hypothetical protein